MERENLIKEYQSIKANKSLYEDYYENALRDKAKNISDNIQEVIKELGYFTNTFWDGLSIYTPQRYEILNISGLNINCIKHNCDEISIRTKYSLFDKTNVEKTNNLREIVEGIIISSMNNESETKMIELYNNRLVDTNKKISDFKRKLRDIIYNESVDTLWEGNTIGDNDFDYHIGGKQHKGITSVGYKLNPSNRSGTLIIKSESTSRSGMLFNNYRVGNLKTILESYAWQMAYNFMENND